jgi:hypothetical protein
MAGRGRVKAEEIDGVIGDYIAHSSLLCTDTATNYKKFAAAKNLKHGIVTFTGIVGLSYIKTWHLKIG